MVSGLVTSPELQPRIFLPDASPISIASKLLMSITYLLPPRRPQSHRRLRRRLALPVRRRPCPCLRRHCHRPRAHRTARCRVPRRRGGGRPPPRPSPPPRPPPRPH